MHSHGTACPVTHQISHPIGHSDTMANHPLQMIYSVLAHATMVTSITPKAMSFNSPLNLSNSTLHAFTSSKLPGTTSKLT